MPRFIYFFIFFSFPLNIYALSNSSPALSASWSSVVQIKSEAPDSKGENIPGYCNATFIGKNILITAAHCMKLAYLSQDKKIEIQTGYYKYITRQDGVTVRIGYVPKHTFSKLVNIEFPKSLIDKLSIHGEKTKIGPGEDFSILWWNEETPEIYDLEFAIPLSPSEHKIAIKNISSHSFAVVTINLFSEMSTDTKRMASLNNYKWNNGYLYSKSNSRVEEGDSGAPLFIKINNENKLFAVTKGRASTLISNWDVYPSINDHLCDLNLKMPSEMRLKGCL